ncbi:MAG: 30S ribosomal protein S20 [Thermodesulfobacteriota bacterium]
MASHKSAIKRARQNEKRRVNNKVKKTRVKNLVKATRQTTAENPQQAAETLREAIRVIDKAASKGVLHRRTASRKIARLSKLVHKAQRGAPA